MQPNRSGSDSFPLEGLMSLPIADETGGPPPAQDAPSPYAGREFYVSFDDLSQAELPAALPTYPERPAQRPRTVALPPSVLAPSYQPPVRPQRQQPPARTASAPLPPDTGLAALDRRLAQPAPRPATQEQRRQPEGPWHGGNQLIDRAERNAAWNRYLDARAVREGRPTSGPPDFNARMLSSDVNVTDADGRVRRGTRADGQEAIRMMLARGYVREVGIGYYEFTPQWYEEQYYGPTGLGAKIEADVARRAAAAAQRPRRRR